MALTVEQRRENNFWHITDYLMDELVCLDCSLSGKNLEELISSRKVDIFDTMENLANKLLDKKVIYGVSVVHDDNNHATIYVSVEPTLSGMDFIKFVKKEVNKEIESDNWAIISIFKIP